jgi:uncharacterized protein (DUF1810 family)
MTDYYLDHFLEAHEAAFPDALRELEVGEKQGHWMWFIFPVCAGIGRSDMAQYFAIENLSGACAYLNDPTLSDHYERCVAAILQHSLRPPEMILGAVDARKFRSSLTLFKAASAPGPHRQHIGQALDAFYGGQECEATLKFIAQDAC